MKSRQPKRRQPRRRALSFEHLEDRRLLAVAFSKAFDVDTIGPGSVSTLTFVIDNSSEATPLDEVAFTDVLPAGVTIANAPQIAADFDGIFSAPAGGTTISLSDGDIAAGAVGTFSVDVTSSTPGVHMNTTGPLTFANQGEDPLTANADLTVSTTLPGFSMSFAPGALKLGERTTLTYKIDNMANGSSVDNLDFTHTLPTGLVLADPTSAEIDGVGTATIPPTLTAIAGGSVVTLDADGTGSFPAIGAGEMGTISVDLIATASGTIETTTGELLADFVEAGKAAAKLEVTVDDVHTDLDFFGDPVPPGAMTTMEIAITNFDRDFPATGVALTIDLGAALTDLTFASLNSNDLGGTLSGVGTTMLELTGGTLAAQQTGVISVELSVPAGAVPDAYLVTTGSTTATVDGSPVTSDPVSEALFVQAVPFLTMEFLDATTLLPDPVVQPGDDVVIRYSVTNTSTTSGATDITFLDELTNGGPGTGFLPFPVTVSLPSDPDPPLGGGSSLALVSAGTDRQALELTGGSLVAAPSVDSTGFFDVTVTLPTDLPLGIYTNTTEEITATVDGETVTGQPSSDTLTVISGPNVSMSFLDPVVPDSTVDLEFTFSQGADSPTAATDIAFTLDLAALVPSIPGLTASLPTNPDPPLGAGSSLTLSNSDTFLTFAGGTVDPGASESFIVQLQVPVDAPVGSHTATTSGITATVDGIGVTGLPVDDDLDIVLLTFEHSFADPVVAGQETHLTYTFQNFSPTDTADITFFTHDLQADLTGLAATGPPTTNETGSSVSGTTFLTVTGGSVPANSTAQIVVPVLIPAGAVTDDYLSITSSLSFNQGGSTTIDPAVDVLSVVDAVSLSKTFLPDTVAAGDTAVIEYTIINNLPDFSLSSIEFMEELNSIISGMTGTPVVENGFTVSGSGTLTIMGSLGPGNMPSGTATFQVPVEVPAGTSAGDFVFTTSDIEGNVDESPSIPFIVTPGPSASLTVTSNPDFGDAPNSYKTSLGVDGARHLPGGPRLGALRDFETNASIPLDGTGDDVTGSDDEDGVTIPTLVQGETATITVVASAIGKLNAFFDFNGDGDFEDAGEHVLVDRAVGAGPNHIDIDVPADAIGRETFARFRISTEMGLSFDGLAMDGEVEDYAVTIEDPVPAADIAGLSSDGDWTVGVSTGASFDSSIWGQWLNSADWQFVQTGDFDGDGLDDIVGFDLNTGNWWVARSTGNGFITANWGEWMATAGWQDVQVADVDGDGLDDVVGRSVTGSIWVAKSVGNGFVNQRWAFWSTDSDWQFVQTGDFNDDGRDDLVGFDLNTGDWWVARSTGSGFVTEFWGKWMATAGWRDVHVADVNGDGLDDLVGRSGTGSIWVAKSTSNSFVSERWGFSPSTNWQNVVVGNFANASPLLTAGGVATSAGGDVLTTADVDPLLDEAIAAWAAAGLDVSQLAQLQSVTVQVADLPGARLGEAIGNTITLDVNAAGYGWHTGTQSPVADRMDLLTVIYHELGHLVGLDDDYSDAGSDDLMNGWLPAGTRRLPTAEDFDALFGDQAALEGALN